MLAFLGPRREYHREVVYSRRFAIPDSRYGVTGESEKFSTRER